WEDVKHLKYDILLIFGGGFALAHGFEKSGLIIYLVQQLTFVQHISVFWMLLFISLTVTVISEFASNIASVQLALPIIAALSKHFPQEMSLKLLFSCVLSASVGFILPVATAPNTIAFGTGRIPLSNMYKAGFWLDLFSIFTISIYCYCFL
ncbi:MAG: anion transporter, partial [Bacteroidetes bacterium]